ncbi:MAG: phage portal protein [Bacteroidales bacterium]|jgi:hypothetical protein|nr:phage portal protein [Bacteroidales bacterium]
MHILGFEIRKIKSELPVKQTDKINPQQYIANKSNSIDIFNYLNLGYNIKNKFDLARLFFEIAAVQFPINYIAKRAINAEFVLKSFKDDSIIWSNNNKGNKSIGKSFEKLLYSANKNQNFKELIKDFIINKLLFGNAYLYAGTSSAFSDRYFEMADNLYSIPGSSVSIETEKRSSFLDYQIKSFNVQSAYGTFEIDPLNILHEKDFNSLKLDNEFQYGVSRLLASRYEVDNIREVYEARNVIYKKRGALGVLINMMKDAVGNIPLTPKEKQNMRDEYYSTYGVHGDQNPIAILDTPVTYVPITASIRELMPFEEQLWDVISISGLYEIPAVLIPRKDQSTFSNMEMAEANVYDSVVIPECKKTLDKISEFLGYKKEGYYIDADFSKVSVLSSRNKQIEEQRRLISLRCKEEYENGIITLNQWRTALGYERINNSKYDELKELAYTENINNKKDTEKWES